MFNEYRIQQKEIRDSHKELKDQGIPQTIWKVLNHFKYFDCFFFMSHRGFLFSMKHHSTPYKLVLYSQAKILIERKDFCGTIMSIHVCMYIYMCVRVSVSGQQNYCHYLWSSAEVSRRLSFVYFGTKTTQRVVPVWTCEARSKDEECWAVRNETPK